MAAGAGEMVSKQDSCLYVVGTVLEIARERHQRGFRLLLGFVDGGQYEQRLWNRLGWSRRQLQGPGRLRLLSRAIEAFAQCELQGPFLGGKLHRTSIGDDGLGKEPAALEQAANVVMHVGIIGGNHCCGTKRLEYLDLFPLVGKPFRPAEKLLELLLPDGRGADRE